MHKVQKRKKIINEELSQTVNNDTRQGCPLSPLLFISALEVLVLQMKDNDIYILEDPEDSIILLLNEYGVFPDLKTNKQKNTSDR